MDKMNFASKNKSMRLILLVIELSIILIDIASPGCSRNKMKFDQKVWLNIASFDFDKIPSKRQLMMEDLELNYIGTMNKEEMIELLGIPDAFDNWNSQDTTIGYSLGGASYLGVKIEFLQIWFDKNGKYLKHKIRGT